MNWLDVCNVSDLQEDSGICALVNGEQVAIFYVNTPSFEGGRGGCALYAISNFDPFGNANVLSRGVIGDLKGQIVVASPLYKQHFNLATGVCLEDENVILPVYASRIENGTVQIGVTS